DLVLGVLAPVEAARRVFVIGDRQRVIVHPSRGDEDRVAHAIAQRRQQRAYVVAGRRRVGDVHEAVDALAGEDATQGRVILAVGDDGLDAGRQPSGLAAPIQYDDVVA